MTQAQGKTAEQILMGGQSGPPDAFKRIQKGIPLPAGTTVGGFVESWETAQSTDIKTGEKLFWPDGNPKQEIRITVQTDLREYHRYEEDDGKRRFFVKESSNMQRAVMGAIVDAGSTFLERGGHLTVTYGGPDPAYTGNDYPPILYTAAWRPAAQGVLMAGAAQPAATPAPVVQPAHATPGPAHHPGQATPSPQTAAQPAAAAPQSAPDATGQAVANLAAAGMVAAPAAQPASVPGLSPDESAKLARCTPEQQAAFGQLPVDQLRAILATIAV